MAITYSVAREDIISAVNQQIEKHHPDLMDACFDYIEASQFPEGKHPCKVVTASPTDKARGIDLVFIYDRETFTKGLNFMSEGERRMVDALIDHSLEFWHGEKMPSRRGKPDHFVYKKNKKGITLHLGVIRRHGAAIVGWQEVARECQQLSLDFDSAPEKSTVVLRKKKVVGDGPLESIFDGDIAGF